MRHSRYFAFFTVLMSVPLLLSYNLKFGPFPCGLVYAAVWSWAILSYFAVPILLVTELILLAWSTARRSASGEVWPWHALALLIATAGESLAVFVSHRP
jgi:hypothetical protein